MFKKLLLAAALFAVSFSPALSACGSGSPPAGFVCAAPAGSPGAANYRALADGHIPSGINAAKVGGGSVSTTEYDRIDGITTYGQSIISVANEAALKALINLEIGIDVQAFDADLTSWAAITRASGFDTFVATPSSANLRSLLTDESGTGVAYFAGGNAGTPSAINLSNGNSLPLTGITSSTTLALGVGTLEVGNASDTTISRAAAGVIAVENVSNTVQPQTCGGSDKISAISSTGVITCSADAGAGGGIGSIVEDTTPQLGGNLDTNGFGIDLGTAQTDTTITRSSAGIMAVEGVAVPTISSTHTLTNKSISATQITSGTLNIGNNAATVGTVEMANGTANTLSASGGVLSIEGVALADTDAATTSAQGLCELATTAEAAAQTDTARCVTPQGLAFKPESICIAASDESTNITTGTNKTRFRMPYAFTLTAVRASVNTAPTGSTIIIDINESGSTLMTTNKLSIDASETTSTTAATAAALTDTALADDAQIGIDFDQVGSSTPGNGVKVCLIGHQ